MCGFAGEFRCNSSSRCDLGLVSAMAAKVAHRGPDQQGFFQCPTGRCAISFHRLAVLDIAGSRQPMQTSDGRYTIAFNGEVYNYNVLRERLLRAGVNFTTAGDTEVLLQMYAQFGRGMLTELEGMFALAVYDSQEHSLFLARDRLGQKPLWWAQVPGGVVFASEAQALLLHPQVSKAVSHEALCHYLSVGYVPAPMSFWSGVNKLPPASCMLLPNDPAPTRYWNPEELPPVGGDWQELVRQRVTASVASHMNSDVALGALLSGGVDSTIVTALMCKHVGKSGGVKSFTAKFDDVEYDESRQAAQTARLLGTDHTELLIRPTASEALALVTRVFAEPFADSSALPTTLICAAARQHVTVALTGDGGDEAFAGYERYRAMQLAAGIGGFGYLILRAAGAAAGLIAPHRERNRLRLLCRFTEALPYPFGVQYFMHRALFRPDDLAYLLCEPFVGSVDVECAQRWFTDLYEEADTDSEVARAQYHDLRTYLPDDLLVKSDLASMASSLELRAPLLDHQTVQIGLHMPEELKLHRGVGKAILRHVFADIMPKHVIKGPKKGFGVPLARWLREDLRGELEGRLLDKSFLGQGIFRPEAVHGLVNDHVKGTDDHSHRLWALLVLAASGVLR
ncbi:MAG: asparagine synthase (glutamine-hydrolyzing) [Planctomycetes bacterium]|nr:asparagine synthase (glutamine-hydrolyzing) [Planctomycetota bacterium]